MSETGAPSDGAWEELVAAVSEPAGEAEVYYITFFNNSADRGRTADQVLGLVPADYPHRSS